MSKPYKKFTHNGKEVSVSVAFDGELTEKDKAAIEDFTQAALKRMEKTPQPHEQ